MVLLSLFVEWVKAQSPLEVFGVITGILCVYLAAKNHILNWPVAALSIIAYMVIFFKAKLYADMGLQVYFFITIVYGWYFWSQKSSGQTTRIAKLSRKEALISMLAIVIFTALLGFVLRKNTDASFPFTDSFCTACSIVAQFFLARKIIENWLIWIFVDVIYIGVYVAKGLYLTSGMYALYVVIAAIGYLEWRKEHKLQMAKQ
ncbi:MAG: nicotinamide mononucleotide transporter [Sphingobacteriales bacterium]|nr:nicotinamide mononucleotide transporter [Sphingobacteriales bacterium]